MERSYNYGLSITSQFYFCGIPFRLDTAPKCALNCVYCFAMARGGRPTTRLLRTDPERIARKLAAAHDTTNTDIVSEMLRRRLPIHFGGMSDPFATSEITQISLRLLHYLAEDKYPVVLSTKHTRRLAEPATIAVIERIPHLAIQVSFSTIHAHIANQIEPAAPSPDERLTVARQLSQAGFYMIARIQPVLPSRIKETASELVPAIADAGFRHAAVEFLKIPVEHAAQQMLSNSPILQSDLDIFAATSPVLIGREWLIPAPTKWEMLQPIIHSIRSNSMTYGAADHGLYHLGDTDSCCGMSHLPGFEAWFKGNISYALRTAPLGRVQFKQIEQSWTPQSSIKRYMNSKCRIQGDQTIMSYIKDKWNRPGSTNAPDTYLGVTQTSEIDDSGNRIYLKCI